MTKYANNMVKLGIFVTLSITVFIVGIYFLRNSKNLFGNSFPIYADFHNVKGLQSGGGVRFSGINAGSIQDISVINDSTIRVGMSIQEKMRPFIKKDAIASIGSDGLVGSMLVNIEPGKSKLSIVEDNDVIQTFSQLDTELALHTLNATNENISLLAINLLEISNKINNGEGLVGTFLNDSLMTKDLRISLEQFKKSSDNLANLTLDLNQTLNDVQTGKGLLGYILKDTLLMPKVQNTIENIDETIVNIDKEIKPLFSKINESVVHINEMTNDLHLLVQNINAGKGTVGNLIYNDTTEQQVQDILLNINQSTHKLNENLEAMRSNWLFKKYFKKKEKNLKNK